MARSCIIIPARLHSSRLPQKVLLPIGHKPMIQYVYEQAQKVKGIQQIIIATDDEKVYDVCTAFGAHVVMTDATHQSGTDRIGEVAAQLKDFDFYINIQADEPLIDASMLSAFNAFLQASSCDICTVYERISNPEDLFNYNVVKLVKTLDDQVLYFSRNAIPAFRDKPYKEWYDHHIYYRHLGIYGFRADALAQVIQWPVSRLEQAESLEQLRWLENGLSIGAMESQSYSIGVDTQEDLDKVRLIITGANP